MLTDLLKQIRENPEKYKRGALAKNSKVSIDRILELDRDWRGLTTELEGLRAEQNLISKNKKFDAEGIERAKNIKGRIKEVEEELNPIEKELDGLLFSMPNIPFDGWLIGKDERENKVLREVGKKTKFDFEPKDYLSLVEGDWIDIERAAKVSGSRFGYLKNQAVFLETALVAWVMNKLSKNGFTPILPPAMISAQSMKAMGYIDNEKDLSERYYFPQDDLFLIGTAEQAIGPMHKDETFDEKELPLRYIGFSPCFRREAGSYGKDTKGILRVHYFEKLEMFIFSKPEDSEKEHNLILSMEEELMQELGIPYRVVQLCSGDIAGPSAGTYDIESWMPGQGEYRETHSSSNCTDFQSRRLNIRCRSKEGTKFVHTLNGTAFAMGRIIIAIIENYQQADGTVKIPDVLKKYM